MKIYDDYEKLARDVYKETNKKESHIQKRAKEIVKDVDMDKIFEDYYKLGMSAVYGQMLYLLNDEYEIKDIKKFIVNCLKDHDQMRCDAVAMWGECTKDGENG